MLSEMLRFESPAVPTLFRSPAFWRRWLFPVLRLPLPAYTVLLGVIGPVQRDPSGLNKDARKSPVPGPGPDGNKTYPVPPLPNHGRPLLMKRALLTA